VKNWSRLKRWTRTGNWGDAEYLRLAYDAVTEQHLRSGNGSKTSSEFEALWRSAEELSRSKPQRELTLARLATKSQLTNQAEELWVRVKETPTMRREALDNLRQLYRAKDEMTKLYDVLQRLHETSPNEATITADLARLALDLGENTERSHQLAKEAYKRAPNDVDCAVTYALSLHRLGRNAEALAIVQGLPTDQLREPHAAVYVALVLAEGGELQGAKDYVNAVENGKLYPEEKKVFEEAKTKLIAASVTPSPGESPALPAATGTPRL
jgi:lipopolysaccharide biosynthesis regulator YciM